MVFRDNLGRLPPGVAMAMICLTPVYSYCVLVSINKESIVGNLFQDYTDMYSFMSVCVWAGV